MENSLIEKLDNKEYRQEYYESFMNAEIAAQIKRLRKERGWSQRVLSYESGINHNKISQMEKGNYTGWTTRMLLRISKAFDMPLKISFVPNMERMADVLLSDD